jgi:hypothetical protein
MRKSRYTEEQIVGILKESEAGMATAECGLNLQLNSNPSALTYPD